MAIIEEKRIIFHHLRWSSANKSVFSLIEKVIKNFAAEYKRKIMIIIAVKKRLSGVQTILICFFSPYGSLPSADSNLKSVNFSSKENKQISIST